MTAQPRLESNLKALRVLMEALDSAADEPAAERQLSGWAEVHLAAACSFSYADGTAPDLEAEEIFDPDGPLLRITLPGDPGRRVLFRAHGAALFEDATRQTLIVASRLFHSACATRQRASGEMGSVHALLDALDAAASIPTLVDSFRAWGAEQKPAISLEFCSDCEGCAGARIENPHGGASICVRIPGEKALAVKFSRGPSGISDAFRRTLIVAVRVFRVSLERLRSEAGPAPARDDLVTLRKRETNLLGSSESAQQLAARLPRLAMSGVGVLIEGETGVGKTFIAKLLHESGARRDDPLRVLNCAAIPEALFESEIFGHERGAFTGASLHRVGALEAVGGGTLFLDEVSELTLANQAKLLRALEDRRFERVGSNKPLELRARVIAATNADLDDLVARGLFRRDLLFRLAVVRVRVPTLRERGEVIDLLARHLLGEAATAANRRFLDFTPDALLRLRTYPWPGNVRELRNAIDHAVALGDGPLVHAHDLPPEIACNGPTSDDQDVVRLPVPLAILEQRGVEAALRATGGNRLRAATLLNVNRSTLYSKIREYGL